ncbi:MAG: polysaccharide deacetylase family protein [Cytophagales bacterium]|nr:polysaccharide deacetylase family protein [Cytophagales bacterium]
MSTVGNFFSPSNSIHLLNGHFISENEKDTITFRRFLNQLRKEVKLTTVQDAIQKIQNKEETNVPIISFTFDDGDLECYTKIAPVLLEFGINSIFFVCPGFVDCSDTNREHYAVSNRLFSKPPMDWSMIKELADHGFIIDSHTYNHLHLGENRASILQHELIDSKRKIEDKIGKPCNYIAWPFGRYSDISELAMQIALENYSGLFSSQNYKYYTSPGDKVYNRRHFEGDWPMTHMNYFLAVKRVYQ